MFALQDIPAGKRIIEYLGTVITNEEADRRGGKYLFELDEKRTIDGHARNNLARYINHACSPNAEAFTTGRRVWIWSAKAIAAGEEITLDYGPSYFEEHIKPIGCKCETCRARIKRR